MASTKRYAEAQAVRAAGEGDHTFGTGLVLRVRGAAASWVFRYTSPAGRRREMGLGTCERATIADAERSLYRARADAHEARELLRKYRDPLDERRATVQAARQAKQVAVAAKRAEQWTLARCARDYHEREIEPRTKPKHSAQWIASLENHLRPALWHRPIAEITAPELLEALRQAQPDERARHESGLGETLRRVRQRLSSVFKDAAFHGRCSGDPAAVIDDKLGKARPKARTEPLRALDYRAAPAFAARLRALPGTAARALEYALLTAARTSEVLNAEWPEIDLVEGVHTVPAARMKRQEQHVVYLPARAIEIVRGQIGQDARWVFPSVMPSRAGLPMSNAALLGTLDRLGMRDRTTVHGLRATFSSWANETAASRPDVIEACLAHREADLVRRAYMRAQFAQERRALLEAWSQYLSAPAALQVVGMSATTGGVQAAPTRG